MTVRLLLYFAYYHVFHVLEYNFEFDLYCSNSSYSMIVLCKQLSDLE